MRHPIPLGMQQAASGSAQTLMVRYLSLGFEPSSLGVSDKAVDPDKAVILDRAEANDFIPPSTLVFHSF